MKKEDVLSRIKDLKSQLSVEQVNLSVLIVDEIVRTGNIKKVKHFPLESGTRTYLVGEIKGLVLRPRFKFYLGQIDKVSNLSKFDYDNLVITKMRENWVIWKRRHYYNEN